VTRRTGRRISVMACVVGLSISTAACSSGPTTLSGKLQAWANNASYSSDVSQIAQDLTDLHNGLKERQFLALRTACEGFGVDVETLYGYLPTPDYDITQELGTSLANYYTAAEDCFYSSSFTSAKFLTYEKLLKSSGVTYQKALAQLRTYGVH
jgi:hypothetical protein